ncbi:hypothetical protein [Mycoplasma struthionis]|uniref:TNase-like domain-containing protein n=1 Tax=Mycoplasma struthionis TaxID=538220 RepID=A0A3G8LIB7_9MOLU|nr:hypothetical protein [Mycoplasma struthionis]AZG68398.1 hypothetical protein EGN60_00165 [Mycoplasma struthionis]
MKKITKFLVSSSLLSATTLVPIAAISCAKKDEGTSALTKNDIKLEAKSENVKNLIKASYPVDFSDYKHVGKVFDQEVKQRIRNDSGEIVSRQIKLWDLFNYAEGEITRIADGDTVRVRITKQPKAVASGRIEIPDEISIRIPMIDTLEENTPSATPRERGLAKMDSDYAKSMLPLGTRVRVVAENWASKSYNRFVAYVFFGDNFERNFGIEMLAAGYTLARLDGNEAFAFSNDLDLPQENAKPIRSYLLPYAAYAFNEGILEKRGFYGAPTSFANPYVFSKEYKDHGVSIVNSSLPILHPKLWEKPSLANEKNNIYKVLELKK